jgi:hypothetical protein
MAFVKEVHLHNIRIYYKGYKGHGEWLAAGHLVWAFPSSRASVSSLCRADELRPLSRFPAVDGEKCPGFFLTDVPAKTGVQGSGCLLDPQVQPGQCSFFLCGPQFWGVTGVYSSPCTWLDLTPVKGLEVTRGGLPR